MRPFLWRIDAAPFGSGTYMTQGQEPSGYFRDMPYSQISQKPHTVPHVVV